MIILQNISKVFGIGETKTHALSDISLKIKQGEFVALMGSSGSGKSTLLHILGLLDVPSSGEYIFDGVSVTNIDEETQAKLRNEKIGFVFQAFHLLPRMSVLQQVILPLMYSATPFSQWESKAREIIEQVGLTHRITHDPSQLSGGEKQRVAIARALVLSPSILFADEPTGNLDSATSAQIMDMLVSLHTHHSVTIVLITHERDIAEYAERIITLKDGKILS